MTPSIRKHLIGALALGLSALASTGAIAEGGEDPMPGIDIIIERDPSSVPIFHQGLGEEQMQRFNTLKGAERAAYLARLVAHYAHEADPKTPAETIDRMLREAMGDSWCGPCRMIDGAPSYRIELRGTGLAIELNGRS